MSEQQPPYDPKPVTLEPKPDDELEMVIYRALKMITTHIEKKRKLGEYAEDKRKKAA